MARAERQFQVGEVTRIREVPEGYLVERTSNQFEVVKVLADSVRVKSTTDSDVSPMDQDAEVRIVALPGQPKPMDALLLKVMIVASGLGSSLRGYENCIHWMKDSYEHPDRHADRLAQIARHATEAATYHAKARGQYEGLLALIDLLGVTPIPDHVQESIDLAKTHNVKV